MPALQDTVAKPILNHVRRFLGNSQIGATGITPFRAHSAAGPAKHAFWRDGNDQIGSWRHRRGSCPLDRRQRCPSLRPVPISAGRAPHRVRRDHLVDTSMKEVARRRPGSQARSIARRRDDAALRPQGRASDVTGAHPSLRRSVLRAQTIRECRSPGQDNRRRGSGRKSPS